MSKNKGLQCLTNVRPCLNDRTTQPKLTKQSVTICIAYKFQNQLKLDLPSCPIANVGYQKGEKSVMLL